MTVFEALGFKMYRDLEKNSKITNWFVYFLEIRDIHFRTELVRDDRRRVSRKFPPRNSDLRRDQSDSEIWKTIHRIRQKGAPAESSGCYIFKLFCELQWSCGLRML